MAAGTTTKSGTDRLRDAERVGDMIADVMQSRWPAWSIDTLLTHPHDAIRMAQEVCGRMGRRATEQAVHEICRIALNRRKHGDLQRDKH